VAEVLENCTLADLAALGAAPVKSRRKRTPKQAAD
jgi:hypothetical protein